jgi:hypothetical protein
LKLSAGCPLKPPKKQQWKNAMKNAINSFWYDKWTNEKQIKSTLEYLKIQQNPIGTPHNEFSISHMSTSFSMDESSLAKVVNKTIAFLSSVVSIGSAPMSV